jgi:hypothetical protein
VCHRTVSGAPPDSVRCTREDCLQTLRLRVSQAQPTIIHRTVRCTTGQCPVLPSDATLNWPASGKWEAAPLKFTGLSGVPRTVRCTTGQCPVLPSEATLNWPASGKWEAAPLKFTGLSGVHRTVRCTSGATVICAQRSTLQSVQLNSECQSKSQRGTGLSGAAPDCPVPHEDKASNGRPAPISTDGMTWLGHRTCPVCTGLSGAPIASSFSNGYKIGWWL